MDELTKELPKYQCHKIVGALKIKDVETCPREIHALPGSGAAGSATINRLVFENADHAPVLIPEDFKSKHNPRPGGYYVVYEDGYKSFSPAKAFEEGYMPSVSISDKEVMVRRALMALRLEVPEAVATDIELRVTLLINELKVGLKILSCDEGIARDIAIGKYRNLFKNESKT